MLRKGLTAALAALAVSGNAYAEETITVAHLLDPNAADVIWEHAIRE